MDRKSFAASIVADILVIAMGVVALVLAYNRIMLAKSGRIERRTLAGQVVRMGVSDGRSRLVVALRSDCRFCTLSLPTLRRIADAAPKTPLVFAASTRDEMIARQLADAQLDGAEAHLWKGDVHSLGIRVTPTTLLVDRNDRIVRSWEGLLDARRGAEIVAMLKEVADDGM